MTGGFNGTSDIATVAVSKIIEHLKMDEKKIKEIKDNFYNFNAFRDFSEPCKCPL